MKKTQMFFCLFVSFILPQRKLGSVGKAGIYFIGQKPGVIDLVGVG